MEMSSDNKTVRAVLRRNTLEFQEETICGAVKARVPAPIGLFVSFNITFL